ncbi:MAG: hypothetical protein ACOY3D_00900 [Candidatus Omnitrophota bacterium]
MGLLVIVFGMGFVTMAAITILRPLVIVNVLDRLQSHWSIDRELFLTLPWVRGIVGVILLLSACSLFYAGFALLR